MASVLLLVLVISTLSFCFNWWRSRQELTFELRANCLLTRHPLLFLTGRRSLLYFANYWNWIPKYLRAHGYEVRTLALPWRSAKARMDYLKLFLKTADQRRVRFHVIADATCPELDWLAENPHHSVVTISRLGKAHRETREGLHFRDLYPKRCAIYDIDFFGMRTRPSKLWRLSMLVHDSLVGHEIASDVVALGLVEHQDLPNVQATVLNHAISLAERDLKCSD